MANMKIIYFSEIRKNMYIREDNSQLNKQILISEYKGVPLASYLNKLKCDYIVLHSLFLLQGRKSRLYLIKVLQRKKWFGLSGS